MPDWDDLSPNQKAAVFHDDGPAAVYAGPGSGKTRVVTLRAARMASRGAKLLVTTFTSDATEEMRARLGKMITKADMERVHVTTLHALCLQLLKAAGIKFALLTDEFQRRSLAETAHAAELDGGAGKFLSDISYQKNCGVTHLAYKHDGSSDDMDFARVWRNYEKLKTEKGLRDFDDLVLDALALLERDEESRARFAARYSHITVDECQDMNGPQYGVAFALGRDHKNVMLVGDLDQSLYGFRGADTGTFRRFADFPKTKVYELRENYRCTRSILAFADSLIRQDENRRALVFVPTRPQGEPVSWQRFPDPDIEALAVGDTILRLVRKGAKYRDFAVLYRTNAQSEAFERHFAALEIPYVMREEGDFYSRKEVQGMLAYLNFFGGAHHSGPLLPKTGKGEVEVKAPSSLSELGERRGLGEERGLSYPDEWLLALLNVPNRKLSRSVGAQLRHTAEFKGKRIWDILPEFHADDIKTHKALRSLHSELRAIDGKLKHIAHAGEAVRIIRQGADFDGWLRRDEGDEKDNDRVQNLQRLQAAAAHYPTIADYLAAVKKVRDEAERRKNEKKKKRREEDEVTLATGHSAKGLEWKYVFAVGWSEEILPHRKAEDMDEERRIAYVIATRARDRLWVSSLDSWNDAHTSPSHFLTGLNLTVTSASEEEDEEAAPALEPETATADAFGGLFLPA